MINYKNTSWIWYDHQVSTKVTKVLGPWEGDRSVTGTEFVFQVMEELRGRKLTTPSYEIKMKHMAKILGFIEVWDDTIEPGDLVFLSNGQVQEDEDDGGDVLEFSAEVRIVSGEPNLLFYSHPAQGVVRSGILIPACQKCLGIFRDPHKDRWV